MRNKRKVIQKRGWAISQIFLLLVSIISIGYLIGSEVKLVSASLSIPADPDELAFQMEHPEFFGAQPIGDVIGVVAEGPPPTIGETPIFRTPPSPPELTSVSGSTDTSSFGANTGVLKELSNNQFPHKGEIYSSFAGEEGKSFMKYNPDAKTWTEVTDSTLHKELDALTPSTWSRVGHAGKIVLNNALYAASIAGMTKWISGIFGANEQLSNAISYSTGAGFFFGKTAFDLFKTGKSAGPLAGKLGGVGKFLGSGWGALGVGVGVTAVVFLITYKRDVEEVIDFQCLPWQPETEGNNCEECNKQGELPCSEYQCRSLGQSCELINPGTIEEKCVWINENDINPPTIEAMDDALLDDYIYTPEDAISPPDRGVNVIFEGATDGCVNAFTPFSFGVELNEPARCKLDTTRKQNFEDMDFFFSDGLLKYNHTYALSLPGTIALEKANITVQNDGNYEIYVRCQDGNEQTNVANFVFRYCVQKGPDTQVPEIVSTGFSQERVPVAFGQDSINMTLGVSEPANCRWTHDVDKSYELMENEFESCDNNVREVITQMVYECDTTLTGIKDRQDNDFYFRCMDLEGNDNAQGTLLTLIGTQPLVIDEVLPNETIRDNTQSVKVTFEAKTSAGYKDGEAKCFFKEDSEPVSDYIAFLNTDSYIHSQDLWFEEGNHHYNIMCRDLGNNADVKDVIFRVEVDEEAPVIVRAFKEGSNLRIITDEKAECVYDLIDCDYLIENGAEMVEVNDGLNHFVDWKANKNLYIKCQDKYTNQPDPLECSMIVNPFNL